MFLGMTYCVCTLLRVQATTGLRMLIAEGSELRHPWLDLKHHESPSIDVLRM